ncbi:DUF456 domain-containing protein [Streptomyces sp. NPDC050504]|uniref:DUF456 domain-containing protein n=1 Tax=Streptomyces sp. NPDC050504 TaxID=3365618 RepID=UPI0037BA2511
MSDWQLALVGVVMLLGLLGVLVPGVPGQAIVWAAVLWWALESRSDASSLSWWILIGATGTLLLNLAVQRLLPRGRPREAGAPRRSALIGGVAGIAGFFVLPVVGGVLGYVGGTYAAERVRLGGHGAGWASTRSWLRTGGRSVLVELMACLLVVGAWAGAVRWG